MEKKEKLKLSASTEIINTFGNAKTSHNDNSSRFSKLIKIEFNESHKIIGASFEA